ncbi:hydroxyacylglutathione hydrolase [Chytriomyces confervae]|uniref:hydroxyacylglutathione hydrolase n=1 Tax=Chytriomyces confervae TaxID=246404 RepID=A0A507EVD9_9FUNG|nr:hydroxyacylglutathione hydrolase [Chytriomyces confervae]
MAALSQQSFLPAYWSRSVLCTLFFVETDLNEHKLGVAIIEKRDGGLVYPSRDVAVAICPSEGIQAFTFSTIASSSANRSSSSSDDYLATPDSSSIEMRDENPEQVPVFGGDDRIPSMTHKVTDKSVFKLGQVEITPFFTVCHTRGSVSYFVTTPESSEKAVFTGDTVFVGGCGRFFEETAEEMHNSLNTILASLPDETSVYCGHEYTASNLSFAASIEPENREIAAKLAWAKSVSCTVPSTLGEEKRINPFMRVGVEQVRQACEGLLDPVEVMAALREKKNNFP